MDPDIRRGLLRLEAYGRAWRLRILLSQPKVTDPTYIRSLSSRHDPRYRWGRN